ncbi:Sodium/hydrogen exchanger family-domain-containing protein [Paraphysoderma sedebokerense]|nr:Sodium/hydrogen exchanger family-domain-containing protein [Paraphysoderma sedebokerense]
MAEVGSPNCLGSTERDVVAQGLLIMGFMIVALLLGLTTKKYRIVWLQEPAVAILIGLATGLLVMLVSGGKVSYYLTLKASFFYTVLLPPIIFEAGYSMKKVSFFKNFGVITSLALIGTLFSTFVTAFIIWLIGRVVFEISFLESMIFGSLLSATDPVSVLATFSEMPISKHINIIIFGESALNDAVAIIFYRVVVGFAAPTAELNAGTFFLAFFSALGVFVGSMIIGFTFGMIGAKISKHIDMKEHVAQEIAMVLIFAYSSYLIAEFAYLSGIVSILFCGIAMAHYLYDNLSDHAQRSTKEIVRVMAYICETILFIYLGLGVAAFRDETVDYHIGFIAIVLFAMLFSRAHVFPISIVANFSRKDNPITFKEQLFIWYAGLRGGIAFILAIQTTEDPNFSPEFKRILLGTVLIIVFLTIIVLGCLTPWTMAKLGITGNGAGHGIVESAEDLDAFVVKEVQNNTNSKSPAVKLMSLDKKYIKPFLTQPKEKATIERSSRLGEAQETNQPIELFALEDDGDNQA